VTVEELNVIVSANKDDFDRKIRMVNENLVNVKKQAEDTSAGTLSAFKTLASGLSALGIGAMIKNAISLAGDLQQNIGGSESVFKNYAGTIQKTAETAASSLGLSQSKYLATATKMGSLFQGSGFSVAQSADMVTQSMQRASDVASIMGISVDSAMEAVAGMAKGTFTMMDNLGVAINDTNLQLYAQEKGLGKLETTQQKVNAAMQMFLDKSDYAAGNYAKENDTYSGALTTFKAELEDFAAEAGTALLPLAQSVLPVLSSSLNALKPVIMVAEAVGGLGSVVSDVQAKVEAATPAQQTMLKIAIGMAVAIPAVTAATRFMRAAKLAYTGVLNILIPKQLTYASALKATMGWIGLIVGVLALFRIATNKGTEGIDDNSEKLEKENEAANKAAKGVDDVAESTDNLTDSVKRSLAGFDELNRLSGNSGTLASSVVSIEDVENADNLADALGDVQNQIKGLNTNIGFDFDFDLSKIWDQISSGEFGKSLLQSLATAITGETDTKIIDDALTNMFNDIFTGNWEDFSENIANGASKSEFVKGLLGIVSGVTDDEILSSAAYDMYKSIFSGNWSKVWENWQLGSSILQSGIKKWVTGGLEKLYGDNDIIDAIVDFVYTILTQGGASIAVSIAKALGDIWKEYGNWVNGLFSDYISEKSPTDNATSGVSMQSGNADSTIPLPIETKKKNWADISSLGILGYADGGFPDYGDLFIANEAGPELVGTIGNRTAVANSSSIETAIYNAVRSAMSDSAGGQSADIHVTVDIDGDTVGETVARYNAVRNRRLNGRS
jgi:hypothetical protein